MAETEWVLVCSMWVGLVMFAYILGPLLFGWYGIFLGPMILVLVVHFGRIFIPELLSGTDIRPAAVDPETVADPRGTPPPTPVEHTDDTRTSDGETDESGDDQSSDSASEN